MQVFYPKTNLQTELQHICATIIMPDLNKHRKKQKHHFNSHYEKVQYLPEHFASEKGK